MPVGNPFISLVKSRFMSGLVFFKALWSNNSTQKKIGVGICRGNFGQK